MQDAVIVSTTDTAEAVLAAHGEAVEDSAAASTEDVAKTAAGSETAEDDEQDTGEKPKGKGGFQHKIDKLTREKYAAEAAAEELRRQLADKEKPAAKPAESKPEGKPVAESFDSYEEYVEALTDWKLEQKEQSRQQSEAQRKAAEERKAVGDAWQGRLKEARTRYADFDATVDADVPVSAAMQQALLDSEQGADLAYWLGKNPTEAERIAKLAPFAAARELGRIEAGLTRETPAQNPKPKTSAAPAPIKPVGKGAAPSAKKPDEMDFQEYTRWREADLKQKGLR